MFPLNLKFLWLSYFKKIGGMGVTDRWGVMLKGGLHNKKTMEAMQQGHYQHV